MGEFILQIPEYTLRTQESIFQTPEPISKTPGYITQTPNYILQTLEPGPQTARHILQTPDHRLWYQGSTLSTTDHLNQNLATPLRMRWRSWRWRKKSSLMTSTASAAEHTLSTTPGSNDGGKPKQIKTE